MIYVDDHKSTYGYLKMAGHLFSIPPDDAALIAFAEKLGLEPRWIQRAGTPFAHFDVTAGLRLAAIEIFGATPVTLMEGARLRHAFASTLCFPRRGNAI